MMKFAAAGLLLLALVVGGGIVRKARQNNSFGDASKEGTLKWHAKKAREKGVKRATIPSPMVEYVGEADSPDQVLANFSLVVARPTESKTYAVENGIVTWFKFRILETVSGRPPIPNLPAAAPPQDLLPLGEDEFLLPKYGGSVSVDDVDITMKNPRFPPFSTDKRYLLFISKDPSGSAIVWAGPKGAFTVTPGEQIESINNEPHPLKDELKNRFDNSIGQLRQKLNN